MVNKTNSGTGNVLPVPVFFKASICILISMFCLSTGNAVSQNISKYYTSYQQETGSLYFIYPQEGFKSVESGNNFAYDITYLSAQDSLTFNFTYLDSRLFQPNSISIGEASSFLLTSPVSKIYVETSKSKWAYRYSCKFLFSDFNALLTSSMESPDLKIYTLNNETIVLRMKKSEWKKKSEILKRIFEVIRLNE